MGSVDGSVHTQVIGANLQGFLLPHEKPDHLVLLILEELCLPNPPFLPLVVLLLETVQLCFSATPKPVSDFVFITE